MLRTHISFLYIMNWWINGKLNGGYDTLLSKLLLFVDSDFVTMALDCDLILMIVFFTINIIFCVSTEQQQWNVWKRIYANNLHRI